MPVKAFGLLASTAILLGTALVQPAAAQVFYPQSTMLENGMQLVVLPNHRAPVVTHMIWYKTGALDDPWGKSGIAHFLEHLMFKGTPKYPQGAYSQLISNMGGTENAFTSYDYTAYYATVGREHLAKIMELESDRMANWQVTDQQVAVEREVILKERQQRTENDPVSAFFEEVNAVLYPNHPYQRPVIGWRHEMKTLNKQDAQRYVHDRYAPNNAVLVISGDIELPEAKALAKEYYEPIAPRDLNRRSFAKTIAMDSHRTLEKSSPLVRETIWSRHRLVSAARPETIGQSDALSVLQKILGDNRTGRLYRRLVVQDKIATSAGISFSPVGYGPQRLAIVVTPLPGTSLETIEKTVDQEIARLLQHGVTEQEVKNATGAMETEAVYARDSVSGPAMAVGRALVSGLDLETVEAWPARMKAVTKGSVDKAAKNLFDDSGKWVTAILKPEAGK